RGGHDPGGGRFPRDDVRRLADQAGTRSRWWRHDRGRAAHESDGRNLVRTRERRESVLAPLRTLPSALIAIPPARAALRPPSSRVAAVVRSVTAARGC